ncbi:conserved hypothetical protein [Leishmania infantum JPCM5]|uniref:Translocon-associated_protein_(TRAP)_ -_alpha_subunit_-_putative n=3 Tax=Leishmania donovani species complex TaxID=38574 RepID=A0A6L0XDD0_LEIIN|nr:conserved hypothetical protein [Leishmania infantum JPCM5]XP_003860763.1 hypothetical protein, conserved [Leishmania donovani]CAC9487567.1 Translocon-associated_protein_(TRAP)_ -_alpha_subunit_-_putative [Leishmania infantum]AYU78717.1 Translocon-associated protein (TRAP), alpha subunit, putative [Leishmania donovani]TPP45385.1 Translocon-associated protein (TRAP), alpha subunit family protein [Leishmania donovani]CAM67967.1 conserved hypothetical protein [Leishmania infantum JPCM5]CBZ3405|eukprot:XP_001465544.1 conserved hypothetical protein [Leishmania infantum JPCM5]
MSGALRKLFVLAFVALLIASIVVAEVVPAEDSNAIYVSGEEADDMYAESEAGADRAPYVSRVLFLNASSQSFPSFHAGSKANVVIAFQNNGNEASQVVFLVVGLLQPPQQYHTTIQNFSVVRQAREVKKSETVSIQYTFTPDVHLESGEFNMVLGLYVQDSATNQTYFITAFNSTVMLEDPLGTDPRTVLTYFTLLAICGGIAYVVGDKLGVVKMIKAMKHSKGNSNGSGSGAKHLEMGTGSTGYDPAYINADHQRYRDEVLHKKLSTSRSRRASASPKKKK